jgi:hypothetical protein
MTPITIGADETAAENAPMLIPWTIPNAGVRAVSDNPELRLVVYYSRLIKGAAAGSMVYNQGLS